MGDEDDECVVGNLSNPRTRKRKENSITDTPRVSANTVLSNGTVDANQGDQDILNASKQRRKEYQKQYYARRKAERLNQLASGEGSTQTATFGTTLPPPVSTRMDTETPERTPLGLLRHTNSRGFQASPLYASQATSQRKKEYNKNHYARQKAERLKQASGESSNQPSAVVINLTTEESSRTDAETPERTRLGILQDHPINFLPSPVHASGVIDITPPNNTPFPTTCHSSGANKENVPLCRSNKRNYNQRLNESDMGHAHNYPRTPRSTDSTNANRQPGMMITRGIRGDGRTLLPSFDAVVTQSSPVPDIQSYDPYDFIYHGLPTKHLVLKDQPPCAYCGAVRIKFEFPTFCCMKGKTKLLSPTIPEELYDLFTSGSELSKVFMHNIRAYNTNFSFTSMGVNLDNSMTNMTSGVYTFRAHGGIYHNIDQLVPREGQPRYLQLYFYDPDTELSHRLAWPNLERQIVQILTRILATNPYVTTFRSLADLGPLEEYRVSLNASVELDQRNYNVPTTSEVAGIWVEGNNNITAYKRSIVVYGRSDYPTQIEPYVASYDPLSYVLFFPNGEPGWHDRIPREGIPISDITEDAANIEEDIEDPNEMAPGRKTVSMREYYCYKFQIRSTPNLILLGRRLFQQFVVDTYIKIETSRLTFCELNQSKIRADLYQGIVDCVNAGEVQPNRIGQRIVLPVSFIGGPRDMKRRYLDAMMLVQEGGKPDIFLTMTCNPNWPEIQTLLLPGQTAQDRPDLVSRVFRAKLEDLKVQLFKRHVIGVVASYVYVIEFQKRGLPHAHFLLIMASDHKMTNPDHYDKIVCCEIPDATRHPVMHELVKKHMIHGPCGILRSSSPCMQGEPKQCRFKYPRQFNDVTTNGHDSYPLYRRRDNGISVDVRGKTLDNRWVVPYNPKLLMMFNCHINVEVCSSIISVKYVFKYVYKGHDRQSVHVDPESNNVVINEIKRFQDARYVSPPEAIWRIYSFGLSQIYPYVMALQIHLPNKQMVRFRDNDRMGDVVARERDKASMLTTFFETNRINEDARGLLYKDFPRYFTWNNMSRTWNTRHRGLMMGRMVAANPAEGERFYLRLLLCHVPGPMGWNCLYTVGDVLYETFRAAALARGLIQDDNNISACLAEGSLFQFPPALRRLFATILIFCEPGDVRKLWDDHYESLSEDYRRQCANLEISRNMVLKDIKVFLQSMGKDLDDFDLPKLNTDTSLSSGVVRELQEEYSIIVEEEDLVASDSLNSDQRVAYDDILRHVDNNIPGVFFIDGPGGTGKTFLYKALLAKVRSRGFIALATASSGAAANNMSGGRTAHSRFKIPINLENNSLCSIKKQSGTAKLLTAAKLIIWDEASMAKRQAVEALDRSLQDITGRRVPFGGKVMVLGGDFRQVLPVVRRGTRAQIVDSSLRMSPLWSVIKKMRLTINMRARTDPWFSDFLLRVGDGDEEVIDEKYIRIPDGMAIPYIDNEASKEELINSIFPSMDVNGRSADYIISRAILSTKNDHVDELNDKLINRFSGEEKTYYSFDEAEDDRNGLYPMEFLNSLSVSGLPPHVLRLKIGCPIILLRNLDPSHGLCNGTRLICRKFEPNLIDAEIAVGQHAGKRVFLPRIPLCPSESDMFPFKLKRKQFPVRLSFAMTINKAQGQTIPNVGVYLPESVFSHGQLYVALSRGISRQTTKVLVTPAKQFNVDGVYTANVVYREVLHDG